MALEILQCRVAHKVTVLAVLGGAECPTGAVQGVVLHGDDTHAGSRDEVLDDAVARVFIPV
jgi:hypothetical protein